MKVTMKFALVLSAAVLTASAAQAALIGHWTFDEASFGGGTGTALDSSGNGFNATLRGGPVYQAGWVGGGSLDLDGVNDYAAVAYNATLALANSPYTIAWWTARDTTTKGSAGLGTMKADEKTGWGAYHLANSDAMYQIHGYGGAAHSVWSDPDNASEFGWNHYALVYDQALSQRRFYVNGVLAASAGTHQTNAGVVDSLLEMTMGALPTSAGGGWNFLDGKIDDVRIYNDVISASDIGTLYAMGGTGTPEPSSIVLLITALFGLVCYAWRKRK